jgi:hypothetical protein
MIENLLKLSSGFRIPVLGNQHLAAHIGRVQTTKKPMIEVESVPCQFVSKGDLQPLRSFRGPGPSLFG